MQVAVPGVLGRQAPNHICLHMYIIFNYSPFLMPTEAESHSLSSIDYIHYGNIYTTDLKFSRSGKPHSIKAA